MLIDYITVAWLTSCSPQGWVNYFEGFMNLEQAKASLSVRQCLPVGPHQGWEGSVGGGAAYCVRNDSDQDGYASLQWYKTRLAVEMGPNVHPCTTPTS